ncbi:sugar kinase [Sphaerochaeta sp.]|jgi:2-dehydro-3-deoxygluconokinase|uniref:sugar kinase n=1 Tax=Sphaerochaeta sp. TaxID=1972642 RepID=UPI002A35A3EF|nr:sugar kinase [Sphaerochaeta sp.]MDX9984119.1 sugar kinase [Sphaerochaeta sp.]
MAQLALMPKEHAHLDFLSLGALVVRLDPGVIPFEYASQLDLHVSGGEFNVAANLSRAFGQRTAIASAMVDYPIGLKIEAEVRRMGVASFYKRFAHDGVRGPNMAHVYSDRGQGLRAPVVFYNRSNEAAALLDEKSFDWDALLAGGVRWFHSGGIFSALSPSTPALIIKAMNKAKQQGAVVSFDLNYREKLWKSLSDKPQEHAQKVLSSIVEHVDVLIGNEEDLQLGLGLKGPEVVKTDKLDPSSFYSMMESVQKRFPSIKAVATTMREVQSTNRHRWSAVLYLDGKGYQAPTCELDVYDRVGGGDGFASGLIYGLLEGRNPQEALRLGWAHGALLTSYPGDTTMATLSQVEALAQGGSARIQR